MEPLTYIVAIKSLAPGASFGIYDNDLAKIDWQDESISQPSDADIETELVRLQAEYDAQEYARNRQTEYPTIEECVHAILDNDNNELDTLQAKRAEIKLKYPKGG